MTLDEFVETIGPILDLELSEGEIDGNTSEAYGEIVDCDDGDEEI
jgi:hypothetical protein